MADRFLVPLVLGITACAIRLPGLGKWCFATDEFLLSQSVTNILEFGVPQFPSGGYYVRGLALQYMLAVPALMFQGREFAIRSIPFVFGVLTVPAFYIFCRKHLSAVSALSCSVILLLSSWHIEFSRFGRFYSAFQFLFILFLYFFYSGYWQDNRRDQVVSWIVSLLAVLVFEASIFLPIIMLISLLVREESPFERRHIEIFVVVAVLVGFNYLVNGVEYRNMGVENALPVGAVFAASGKRALDLPIHTPTMLLSAVRNSTSWILFYLLVACSSLYVFVRLRSVAKGFWETFAVVLGVSLPLVHQYALLGYILFIVLLNREDVTSIFLGNLKTWIPFISVTLVFWLSIIAWSGNADKTLHYLIGFPPVKYSVVLPFAKAVPVWGLLAGIAIAISAIRQVFFRPDRSTGFLLTVIVTCCVFVSLFTTPYDLTRYSFFFFPLVLMLPFLEMSSLSGFLERRFSFHPGGKKTAVLAAVPLLVFFSTEDFHFRHVIDVSAMDINFRMGEYERFTDHWHERFDYETPGMYVNDHYKPGDNIVIDSIPFSYYLKNSFSFYSPTDTQWFTGFSRNYGREEIWTGHPMFYELSTIEKLVPENGQNHLYMISKEDVIGGDNIYDIARKFNLDVSLKYIAVDGRFKVWQMKRAG